MGLIVKKCDLKVSTFKTSIDHSESSSYREDAIGSNVDLISRDHKHIISWDCRFRSLIPVPRGSYKSNVLQPNIASVSVDSGSGVSGSVGDEQFPSVKSSIIYSYNKDTRNSKSLPSNGYRFNFQSEIAGLGCPYSFFFFFFFFFFVSL